MPKLTTERVLYDELHIKLHFVNVLFLLFLVHCLVVWRSG